VTYRDNSAFYANGIEYTYTSIPSTCISITSQPATALATDRAATTSVDVLQYQITRDGDTTPLKLLYTDSSDGTTDLVFTSAAGYLPSGSTPDILCYT